MASGTRKFSVSQGVLYGTSEYTAKSPIALRLAKEAMNRVEFLPLRDAYRTEQDYTARLMTFEDSAEARAAFLERRPPEWRWR